MYNFTLQIQFWFSINFPLQRYILIENWKLKIWMIFVKNIANSALFLRKKIDEIFYLINNQWLKNFFQFNKNCIFAHSKNKYVFLWQLLEELGNIQD